MKTLGNNRCIVTAVAALCLTASAIAATDTYTLTDLGLFRPLGINNFGQLAGTILTTDADGEHLQAAFWTPSSANTTNGTLITMNARRLSKINDVGQMIGDYGDGTNLGTAFLWTPNSPHGTTGTKLDLSGSISYSYGVSCLNNSGQVAYSTLDLAASTITAYLWTPTTPNGTTGTATNLGNFFAQGMNDYGQICCWTYGPSYNAFLWTPTTANAFSGSLVSLGSLSDAHTAPLDINSMGQVVGVSEASNSVQSAFLWNPTAPHSTSGTMINLALGSPNVTSASGVDESGTAYGGQLVGLTVHAEMFKNGQIVDLNSFFPAGSAFQLEGAIDGNEKGQIIGVMAINGEKHGFLLTPKSTQQEIVDIKKLVQNLVDIGALLPANGQSLFAKLNSALAKVASGDKAGAVSDLKSFINQVTTFVKTGRLTTAQGQPLIDAANTIISQLSS